MRRIALVALLTFLLLPVSALAVDGVVLINTSTVMAAGGFPYIISIPGSYKLSGNLIVTTSSDGIDINADDVILDLNGFRIIGPVVCSGTPLTCSGSGGSGILAANRQNVTVKNGVVRGFSRGVQLVGVGASGGLIADVQTSSNSDYGIYGVEAVIVRCSANNNRTGIAAVNSTVADTLASHNRFDGFEPYAATFVHNTAVDNGRYGIASVLPTDPFLIGSNIFVNNGTQDVVGGTSQSNNRCTSGPC